MKYIIALLCALLPACASTGPGHVVHVSVADQKMRVFSEGKPVATYPVSTSKFGLGSQKGSFATPLGRHRIAKKIGDDLPVGAVLKSRKSTGEVLPPGKSKGDPIVTRILWLDGMEKDNRNTFQRYIYIHGTPAEKYIGKPASYGCVRMRSKDVVSLFERVDLGTEVLIFEESLRSFPPPAKPETSG